MTVNDVIDRLYVPLPRHLLVEAVYLSGRLLSHRMDRNSFLTQLRADTAVEGQERAVAAVLGLADALEADTGQPVTAIPDDVLRETLRTLDRLFWTRIDTGTISRERAEELLQRARRHWPSAAE